MSALQVKEPECPDSRAPAHRDSPGPASASLADSFTSAATRHRNRDKDGEWRERVAVQDRQETGWRTDGTGQCRGGGSFLSFLYHGTLQVKFLNFPCLHISYDWE